MTLRSDTGRPIVYLHIGAMKTGTTYLQKRLFANRDELGAAGLVLPGAAWADQVRGVQDVLHMGRWDPHVRRVSRGGWQELVDQALARPDNVSLISVEFLSFAGPLKARRVMRTLSGADVRVIVTVRDMAATLPSQWQTLVHNFGRWSWPEYLEAMPRPTAHPVPGYGRVRPLLGEFHRTQNVPRMLAVWGRLVPSGALHVVTVPRTRKQPDELWRRFAEVVGVDPHAAPQPPKETNPSLGHASTEVVRRINKGLGRLRQSEYIWTVREPVALKVLAGRAPQEGRAQLTRAAYRSATRWNALTREAIVRAGAHVVGDLDDLPTIVDPAVLESLPDVSPAPPATALLDAGEAAAEAFEQLAQRRGRKLSRLGIEVPRPERSPLHLVRAEWEKADDPVDAAAADLADRAKENALLLRRLRRQSQHDTLS